MNMPDQLISRQMRRWELDQRLQERFARDEQAAQVRRNIVTISRERGSGGTLVGMMVAKELDWDFYDRELINDVAQHMGVDPANIAAHDERAPSFVQNVMLQLLEGKTPTKTQYLRSLVRIVRSIRSRGNAVIIGRAAHLIAPDALRIRVVAPVQMRVERVAELEDMSLAQAEREVLTADREREQFIRSYFGVDSADPVQYDLIINTAATNLEHAAHLVICALESRRQAGASAAEPI
ncbi:MAG TPA: cytidylate kinase-like family protein [Armatimonadota bacterium]|jgi:cytidylate kinase